MKDRILRYGVRKIGDKTINKNAKKKSTSTGKNKGKDSLTDETTIPVFGPDSEEEYYMHPIKNRRHRKDVYFYHDLQGIPIKDAKILVKIKKRARRLDAGMNFCGFRLGYGALLALIPGVGDIGDLILSYTLVYRKANKVTPGKDLWAVRAVLVRNLGMGFAIGAFPIIGACGLAVVKCNWRSAKALEEMLLKRVRMEQEQHGAATDLGGNHGRATAQGGSIKPVVTENLAPGKGKVSGHTGETITPKRFVSTEDLMPRQTAVLNPKKKVVGKK